MSEEMMVYAVEEPEEEIAQNDRQDDEVKTSGVLRLKKTINLEGKVLTELRYDFDNLTPKTYTEIVKKVGRKENVTVPSLNLSVQANLFCRAAEVPAAIVATQMSIPDFEAACALARDFLLSNSGATEEDLI